MKVKSESEVAQSCPTLSNPVDCSLPGSSVHGIFQARVLEWGATATWCKKLTHWKRLWCCERLKAGGERDYRWMASLTWWTWVWENSRSWWWTGKPGMLQCMGSQRVGHDWTELKYTLNCLSYWFPTERKYLSSGFPGSSVGNKSARNAGDPHSIPGLGKSSAEGIGYPFQHSWAPLVTQLVKNPPTMQILQGRSPGERKGYPLQYSGLGNSMDCIVHRVAESDMTEGLSLSQIEKEWGIKACSTWNLPLMCHSFSSRLIFKIFWHLNNVNSEFDNCNQKMFQSQAPKAPKALAHSKKSHHVALKHFSEMHG